MSGRRGRGRAKDSPARGSPARGSPARGSSRGRGRGRGRGKAQAENESAEVSPVAAPHVSEAIDPSNSVSDKATSEMNAISCTKVNDLVESCTGNLQSTEETVETTLESKEPEVKTDKESDIINIDADAVCLAVSVTDSSLEPSSNEPDIIELDSDDDDDDAPAKVIEEKKLISSNVETKESIGLVSSANEKHVYDGSDVINLDDDDDDKDDDHKTTKDEHHFYCTVCDINCKTKQGFGNHAKGFYHRQRVKKTNEDKTVRDEEEKRAVDAAAAAEAESNQLKDGEEMDIEMDASTTETVDITKSSQGWILLDQVDMDETEGMEEDKSMGVSHDDSSAAERKEEPETVMCDASGGTKEATSNDGDEQIKERVNEVSCGIDGVESTEVDMKVVTDKSNEKEADDNVPINKTDEIVATHKAVIDSACYTVDNVNEDTGKHDVKEVECYIQNKESSESGPELTVNNEKNIDGVSSAASGTSVKEETDHTESKEIVMAESNEQGELKSEETEEAEDSKEQGDAVVDPYYCAACDVRCGDDKAYHMHTRGMMHTLNCGSSSSAAERPKPVPQVYRVPKTLKGKSKKSGTKKPKARKPAGEGTDSDVILIDDDSDETEEEEDDDVEEVEGSINSKEFEWMGGVGEDKYYCDVCDCSMTSEQNYEAHLIGARHKKNMKNRDLGVPVKKPKGKVAIGGHQAKVVNCEPKAQEMLNNCKDALIGLQYMTEFCHSSPDVEPRYVCNLCEAKCDIRMVKVHLTGLKHRINYLKKHHTNYAIIVQQRTRKSDQTPLADQFAKEIETLQGRQTMVVKMDMGGNAASGFLTKGTNDEQETASGIEPQKRRASSGNSKSPSGRTSPIDIRSVSPEDRQKPEQATLSSERRGSRSDSRRRDRSPRRLSERRRTRSRSRDRRSSRDRYPYHKDYDRDRWRDRRSSERDRHDHDYRVLSPERRRRSDYNRHEQDSRTEQGLRSAAQALYACGTNYPYAQTTGVPYGLVPPSAFAMNSPYPAMNSSYPAMNSSYPAALSTAYPIAQRAMSAAPPPPKRSRFSETTPATSVPMSYTPPNFANLYGSLGAPAPYADLYGARFMGSAPQPVPPVTQSPLLSRGSTGYQRSPRLPSAATYGTKLGGGSGSLSSRAAPSDDSFATLSSIVASVSTGTRDDDEAAAMSKVIAEAVIKYKMQKAQEKINKQPPPQPDRYQRRY